MYFAARCYVTCNSHTSLAGLFLTPFTHTHTHHVLCLSFPTSICSIAVQHHSPTTTSDNELPSAHKAPTDQWVAGTLALLHAFANMSSPDQLQQPGTSWIADFVTKSREMSPWDRAGASLEDTLSSSLHSLSLVLGVMMRPKELKTSRSIFPS